MIKDLQKELKKEHLHWCGYTNAEYISVGVVTQLYRHIVHTNKRVKFKNFRHLSYHINMNSQQFQPLKVSVTVKQAVLHHNITLLHHYYTLSQ